MGIIDARWQVRYIIDDDIVLFVTVAVCFSVYLSQSLSVSLFVCISLFMMYALAGEKMVMILSNLTHFLCAFLCLSFSIFFLICLGLFTSIPINTLMFQ